MAPSTNPQREAGPVGEWLFRQGDLTLGPVRSPELIEKLFSGDVGGATPITPMGQSAWRPLREVDGFKLHLAKAEAKLRVDAVARTQHSEAARKRNARIAIVAALAVTFAGLAAAGARHLAVYNPFKNADELALSDISVEPPQIKLARRHADEDLVDYPSEGNKSGAAKHGSSLPTAARTGAGRVSPALGTRTGSDGLETAKFDQAGINSVVASKQKSLYPCLQEEARRSPGLTAHVPIEFVIGNDGHVSKLWVDNPSLKAGPLQDCLFRELQKWPFRPYDGERATVSLSFDLKRRG